ncbi:Uma2 family endonuclease [cf. Phormidesmis sp. LEGE 11477]|uniref:Uma2 family endonuclease n=1 Tax=cf. Phormidesmis sp. LEGE 11477 TaxID=1828680 RepID=UPI00187FB457|nr:Uma2 family endonuclease [cf. Phormidesmis sp. LEGE 11477]MBE9061920.1 Uma2 family endonuclease [cf. Phormidesmis sp. LEGE 11477]
MTFTRPNTKNETAHRLARHELPTMYDLPSEFPEEPGLPDVFHHSQPELLSLSLALSDYTDEEYFVGTDLNVYYDLDRPLWHKRPDWFVAVGVPPLYEERDMRLSYVTWQEPANPYLIIELISPGTEDEDLGKTSSPPGSPPTKWTVYEQILKVPYYVVFNRYTDELKVFKLEARQYREQALSNNRFWIPELKIGIGLWHGIYRQGNLRLWLRWYGENEDWLLTGAEGAKQEAEAEKQRAEVEQQRANAAEAKLAALQVQLRRQGIDPDTLL